MQRLTQNQGAPSLQPAPPQSTLHKRSVTAASSPHCCSHDTCPDKHLHPHQSTPISTTDPTWNTRTRPQHNLLLFCGDEPNCSGLLCRRCRVYKLKYRICYLNGGHRVVLWLWELYSYRQNTTILLLNCSPIGPSWGQHSEIWGTVSTYRLLWDPILPTGCTQNSLKL
jgi:hypothetical protein